MSRFAAIGFTEAAKKAELTQFANLARDDEIGNYLHGE
jgi:hypothetical protein